MASTVDNTREQFEYIFSLFAWSLLVCYILFTFWIDVRIIEIRLPAAASQIPPETYAIPFIMLWAVSERMVSHVNPSGWGKAFWNFVDRWKSITMMLFVIVTMTYAYKTGSASYVAMLAGIVGYAAYDAYDNWWGGHVLSSDGVPFLGDIPDQVEQPIGVIFRPKYFLEHPVTGEKKPWDPRGLIEHGKETPPATS